MKALEKTNPNLEINPLLGKKSGGVSKKEEKLNKGDASNKKITDFFS